MGGDHGGSTITPGDPNAAADQCRATQPSDPTGINMQTKGDLREEVKNHVSHSEADNWIEVKGNKGEIRIGAFFELIGGLRHSMTLGPKTAIDLAYYKTFNIGPYTSNMIAAKYERLGSKKEKVHGWKKDKAWPLKYEKTTGDWKETNAKKRQDEEAFKKLINDKMTERVGALLEERAKKCKENAEKVRETVRRLDRNVAHKLRVSCEEYRSKLGQFEREVSKMETICGKLEQKSKTIDMAIGSLMDIKAKKIKQEAQMMECKAGVLKFAADLVKLGE